jgi:hypothetical protein
MVATERGPLVEKQKWKWRLPGEREQLLIE